MTSLLLTFSICLLVGCDAPTGPTGPEKGALKTYLDEHPELNVENDQSVDDEDEFGNADGEAE